MRFLNHFPVIYTRALLVASLLAIFPSAGFSKSSEFIENPLEHPLSQAPLYTNTQTEPVKQDTLKTQRKLFLEAEKALKKGRRSKYRKLLTKLRDYPLYPYLLYTDLRKRIHSAKSSKIEHFLVLYADSPLAYRLRRSRLSFLARNRRWEEYLALYEPTTNLKLKCNYHLALIRTGQLDESFYDIESVWLQGRSLPKSCNPVLSTWKEHKKITPELAWKRIELAMKKGKSRLARHLSEYLPENEQQWVNTWYKIHHKPSLITKRKILNAKHHIVPKILTHGIKRFARYNPEKSVTAWEKIKKKNIFSPDQEVEIYKAIGTAFQRRGNPEALTWLAKVPFEQSDKKLREWRVRITLKSEDWEGTLHWINQLNEEEQKSERWQYWRARALEGLGESQKAEEIYSDLAMSRSYESFLAAERMGLPYKFLHQPLAFSDPELDQMRQRPGMLRARELLALDKLINARREWYAMTRYMDDRSLQMAAKIANDWDWHERGILTLAQSSNRDDLEIRFPIVHKSKVIQYASTTNVEPAWAFSIIRQESAFAADARSPRNARGLMQLLPRTARAVARSLKTKLKRISDLNKADINIRFGIAYLKKMTKGFNNNIALATAAYNAGEYRVRKWLPKKKNIAPDIWVETIPFTETRNYLRNILSYTLIYEHRLGHQLTPLSQRMPQITPWNKVARQDSAPVTTKTRPDISKNKVSLQ